MDFWRSPFPVPFYGDSTAIGDPPPNGRIKILGVAAFDQVPRKWEPNRCGGIHELS